MLDALIGSATIVSAIASLLLGVVSTAIAFLVKERLNRNKEFGELKHRLETFAGKNSLIIYKDEMYRIVEIHGNGLTLQGHFQRVFVPAKALTQTEVVMPYDDYELKRAEIHARRQLLVQQQLMPQMMKQMADLMFAEIFPRMQQALTDNIMQDGTEVSMAFAVKLRKLLADEGLEVKKNPRIN